VHLVRLEGQALSEHRVQPGPQDLKGNKVTRDSPDHLCRLSVVTPVQLEQLDRVGSKDQPALVGCQETLVFLDLVASQVGKVQQALREDVDCRVLLDSPAMQVILESLVSLVR